MRHDENPRLSHHKGKNLDYVRIDGQLPPDPEESISMAEALLAYVRHCESYYGADNLHFKHCIKPVIRAIREPFEAVPSAEFSPRHMKVLVNQWSEEGLTRKTINDKVSIVKKLFKFLACEGYVPIEVYQWLYTVDGLRKGRSKEGIPVGPVAWETVKSVEPFVSPQVWSLIRQ